MSLGLLPGQLVPWAAGYFLFSAVLGGRSLAWVNRNLGYGFFFGAVMVFGAVLVSHQLAGGLAYWSALALLLVVTALAFAMSRLSPAAPSGGPDPVAAAPGRLGRVMTRVLLAVATIHIALSALEIITLPMFPWDAWTVWGFRAKAWFLNGELFDFVDMGRWLSAEVPAAYTQPALSYPLLPSIIPLWAAMSMGQWHDAMVNTPVILCGLAIVLAMHGQVRSMGVAAPVAALGLLVLVSTPIFAAHMSLGGYADIWLAGFAGLGFVALMVGVLRSDRSQLALGLVMLLMGLLVKAEGLVWLCAGFVFLAVALSSSRRLWWVLVGLLATVLVLLWWQPGIIELPIVGTIGIAENTLHVPLKGAIPIARHDVGAAYVQNTLVRDNWHLAWPSLLVLALLAVLSRRVSAPVRRVVFAFFGVVIVTQVLIFGFTSQGEWAADYTAINRLPLQVYPAVVFAAMLLIQELVPDASAGNPLAGQRLRVTGLYAGALLLSVAVLLGGIWLATPGDARAPGIEPFSDMQFVMGEGHREGDAYVIDRYQDGVALLTSGPIEIDAGTSDLLRLDVSFADGIIDPDDAPAFFWRLQAQPGEVSRITLLDHDELVDLGSSEDWSGTVTEVGFLFLESAGAEASVRKAVIEEKGVDSAMALLAEEWFGYEPWTQRSAHSLAGGAESQRLALPTLVAAWLLVVVLLALWLGPRGQRINVILLAMLVAWFMLDARWLVNRVQRMALSVAALSQPVENRMSETELGRLDPWLSEVAEKLPSGEAARILVLYDRNQPKYFAWRSKYQLLPHNAAVYWQMPTPDQASRLDYILVVGDFVDLPAEQVDLRRRVEALSIPPEIVGSLSLVNIDADGMLFAVNQNAEVDR
ncbi:hypothetical protein F3N42_03185 [Marinihelvus fidelis]|uniref:Uncharacterized protein n=1 Tax=Marinihelvus fidelis TaxID=2613842 RepID=A0A5N0THN3_9GAMM|nr:hypothetical protein [Marinihelvus fidelis]KAA9133366.1 hypothetical protein F3N42_03185 [Marinihelvus fidelis]